MKFTWFSLVKKMMGGCCEAFKDLIGLLETGANIRYFRYTFECLKMNFHS